jgi:hypothetical protein
LDQAGAQSHERALPAAQGAHRSLLHVGFAEAEDLETTTHLALEAGSSQFCEAPQELPMALQHPLHPAQVGGHLGRAELRLASVELPLEFRDLRTRRADHLGWCTVVANDVLGKVGRAQPRRQVTSPPSTSSEPARMRSRVDLPAPLPPMRPILAPGPTFIPRPRSRGRPP